MNYIGSKLSLLAEINATLEAANVPRHGIGVDLFAGTGAVGQALKRRGHTVLANDWQHYSYVTNVALIELSGPPQFVELLRDPYWMSEVRGVATRVSHPDLSFQEDPSLPARRVLRYLESLPGGEGSFFEAYCESGRSGRIYFSESNGRRIQAVRDRIECWTRAGLISGPEQSWLVACLLEGADRIANTASVYGAYLKRVKASARKPLRLPFLAPVPSAVEGHRASCLDSRLFVQSLTERPTLVYIDPPYNARQYSTNYHVLETLARWDLDRFQPRGVTGLRPSAEQRSPYCSKVGAEAAFDELLAALRAEYVLFSYNNEGLLSLESLVGLMRKHCTDVQPREVAFKRFRADSDHENRVYKTDVTREFLILGTHT